MREITIVEWFGAAGTRKGDNFFTTALENKSEAADLVEWLELHDCRVGKVSTYKLEHFKDGSFYRELTIDDVAKQFPDALQGGVDQFFNRWHPSGRWDKSIREFWTGDEDVPLFEFFEQDGVLRGELIPVDFAHRATGSEFLWPIYWWPERKRWYAMDQGKRMDPETYEEIE